MKIQVTRVVGNFETLLAVVHLAGRSGYFYGAAADRGAGAKVHLPRIREYLAQNGMPEMPVDMPDPEDITDFDRVVAVRLWRE